MTFIHVKNGCSVANNAQLESALKTIKFSDATVRNLLKVAREEYVAVFPSKPVGDNDRYIVHVAIRPADSSKFSLTTTIFDREATPKTPDYTTEADLVFVDLDATEQHYSTNSCISFVLPEEIIGARLRLAK